MGEYAGFAARGARRKKTVGKIDRELLLLSDHIPEHTYKATIQPARRIHCVAFFG